MPLRPTFSLRKGIKKIGGDIAATPYLSVMFVVNPYLFKNTFSILPP